MSAEPKMGLRAYQRKAVDMIQAGFAEFGRQLLVVSTGGGKTQIFCETIRQHLPGRSLVLCHREELIGQAVRRLESFGIPAEVEMAGSQASLDAPAVVGSVQSLMRDSRLTSWPQNHFDLVVADEAHRAMSDSWQKVLRYFDRSARVLGVTATPERSDKRHLGKYFQNIPYEIGLLDLVQQGWLAPIKVKTVPLGMNLDSVRTTAGDFNADDLGHALEPYLEQIADVLVEHRHRKTIVFLPLISVSKRFAELCRERGLEAEHVDGQSTDRQAILERFKRDETRILTNAMLLTEGYDEPGIDCVVCLRPTKVRALYAQIIGRGTRICPGKDHLLVLDFLWQSGEHSLVKPAHLIAEDEEDARALTEKLGDEGDMEEAREAVDADRTRSLAERLHANRRRKGSVLDPLELAVTLNDAHLAEFTPVMQWQGEPPTAKQLDVLGKFGMDANSILTKGHAPFLLDRLITRRKLELATPKQVRLLRKYDHPRPEMATFKAAQAFLAIKFGSPA